MEHMSGMVQVLNLASGVAVISMILIQLLKKTAPDFDKGGSKVRFLPLISILIGLVIGALVYPFTDLEITLRLWSGFFAGAGASGLYDLSKIFKRDQEE